MRPVSSSAMPGPERQRHPLRPLQLEVRQMDAAIRREREHQAGHDRGTAVAGEPRRQQIGEEGRRHDADQHQHVGDAVGVDPEGRERRPDQSLQQDGIRVGQGPAVGPEDVAVEEVRGVPDLVRDPAQPPRRERRIEMRGCQLGQPRRERPCENDTEHRVKKEDPQVSHPRPVKPLLQRRGADHAEMRNIGRCFTQGGCQKSGPTDGCAAARAVCI